MLTVNQFGFDQRISFKFSILHTKSFSALYKEADKYSFEDIHKTQVPSSSCNILSRFTQNASKVANSDFIDSFDSQVRTLNFLTQSFSR